MKTSEFSADDLATLNRLYAVHNRARWQIRRNRLALAGRLFREVLAALWGALHV